MADIEKIAEDLSNLTVLEAAGRQNCEKSGACLPLLHQWLLLCQQVAVTRGCG